MQQVVAPCSLCEQVFRCYLYIYRVLSGLWDKANSRNIQ